jgi:hypothetical protein
MNVPRYPVTLTLEQRDQLTHLIRTGSSPAYQQVSARVLLKLDRNQSELPSTDQQVADALSISRRTVIRIKERFASQGLEAALRRNYPPTHPLQRRVHGREEAQLIALACGPAPEGQQRWTLRLLADRMVQLHSADQISYESVPQVLKK